MLKDYDGERKSMMNGRSMAHGGGRGAEKQYDG